MIIFVKSVQRCSALAQLLVEQNFPAISIHRGMEQEERWDHVMVSFVLWWQHFIKQYYKILNLLSKKLAGLLVNTNSNSLNYNSHFTQTFILLRLLCQWWNSFTIARIISLPFINFVFCSLADCHATDSSKISQRGCWLPPIYLAVEWTSKESTLFSITTCQRTLTPTFTGFVNSFHSFWKGVSFSVVSTSIETCFVMGK